MGIKEKKAKLHHQAALYWLVPDLYAATRRGIPGIKETPKEIYFKSTRNKRKSQM